MDAGELDTTVTSLAGEDIVVNMNVFLKLDSQPVINGGCFIINTDSSFRTSPPLSNGYDVRLLTYCLSGGCGFESRRGFTCSIDSVLFRYMWNIFIQNTYETVRIRQVNNIYALVRVAVCLSVIGVLT